ncbi:hypothetical protein M8C21_005433 [Ambrosia artemisiifolia]|uniref:Uncharacterized protein n=1 Tax=Ambrosia artemisiifolia TaxID=4212 RepID=A0AAD5GV83_AMBAR|nr:hypothetical protein M8C21_005433 [Ambrosia artemisiifolia]
MVQRTETNGFKAILFVDDTPKLGRREAGIKKKTSIVEVEAATSALEKLTKMSRELTKFVLRMGSYRRGRGGALCYAS